MNHGCKVKTVNKMNKEKLTLVELDDIDTSEDPVRPDLDVAFRTCHGRKIYGLQNENKETLAIMCFAFTDAVPTNIEELDIFSKDSQLQAVHRNPKTQGSIAVAYTVWTRKKGYGKQIVNEVYKMVKKSNHLNRLVTLSPLTDMARNFHLKNGAKELQVNETSQNFEYDIELEQWMTVMDRVKKWFKK